MDGQTFDRWTAGFAATPTRREALRLLSGLGLAGVLGLAEADAEKKCRKRKGKKKGRRCKIVDTFPTRSSFCVGKNQCLTMDAACAAPGAATACSCLARAHPALIGESFCASEAGAGPVADCAHCPPDEACLDLTGCGGGFDCRQPCPNPISD